MSTDSQHWYTREGAPFYEVKSAKGELRPVTLRDARKIGAVPSVTTVLQVIAKPQLERWKRNQVVLAALTLPRIALETSEELLARIEQDGATQAREAAEEGSRIHDALEAAYQRRAVPSAYQVHVQAVRARLAALYSGVHDWVSERSFASPEGYGGKVDLYSPSTGITVDFKGKDGDFSDGKTLAYDQHWQLAAYQAGLKLPQAPCVNLFISRTHPGCVQEHVWSPDQVADGLLIFRVALTLWKAIKRYDPKF